MGCRLSRIVLFALDLDFPYISRCFELSFCQNNNVIVISCVYVCVINLIVLGLFPNVWTFFAHQTWKRLSNWSSLRNIENTAAPIKIAWRKITLAHKNVFVYNEYENRSISVLIKIKLFNCSQKHIRNLCLFNF